MYDDNKLMFSVLNAPIPTPWVWLNGGMKCLNPLTNLFANLEQAKMTFKGIHLFVWVFICVKHRGLRLCDLVCYIVIFLLSCDRAIGHVNEYPTMHYFGNPKKTQ